MPDCKGPWVLFGRKIIKKYRALLFVDNTMKNYS
jgi:hypothetical protein